MAEKVTGKDLKQLRKPDPFQAVSGRAVEFVLAHQRRIGIAVGAVVAVALIAWVAAALRSRSENQAGQQLAEALRVAARPIAGEGVAQPGEETFPNKADRTKAALEALERVRKEHGSTTAAQTATLQLGLLKQQSGDAASAVPLLNEFLNSAAGSHPMRATALEALGYAHEAQGKLDDAKAAFGKLKDAGAPERGAYQLARISMVEKKPDARDQLAAVAKEYAKDPVALEANLRLEVASLPDAPVAAPAPPAAPAAEKKKKK